MSTTTVGILMTTWVADVGTVLSDNLPAILVITASLFGLILIVKLAKRFLSGR